MILCGYPCIGKTSLTNAHSKICGQSVIDLESSNFIKDENWAKSYVNVAIDLSEQGFCVFTSTHSDVIKYLNESEYDYTTIVPSKNLEKKWKMRAFKRYNENQTQKNKAAFLRIMEHFDDDIDGLCKNSKHVITILGENIDDLSSTINSFFSK